MADKVALLLAPGFEEIEATGTIDVLRRAGLEVAVTGVESADSVEGAHGLKYVPDCALSDISAEDLAAVVLPGGMPGATNLASNPAVIELLKTMDGQGRYVAAICAAPLALEEAGLLKGRRVTAYPAVQEKINPSTYTGAPAEQDGRLITGKGPGAVFAFALKLVTALCGEAKASELQQAMVVPDAAAK